jgi:hypothetical protein
MGGKQTKSKGVDTSAPASSPSAGLAGPGVTTAGAEAMYSLGSSMAHDMFGESAIVGSLDETPEDPVQALREAASGNFVGMVDERYCLALLGVMTPAQLSQVAGDAGLINSIGAAFNPAELRAAAGIGSAALATKLFEQRFGIPMKGRYEHTGEGNAGSQSSNSDVMDAERDNNGEVLIQWEHQDVLDVWDTLATLPAQDVSENSVIIAFEAISGRGAFWGVSEARGGSGEVMLGQAINDRSPQRLEHTVRHEIGHAVHDSMRSSVDAWLSSGVGFKVLGEGRAGCEALVNALGGFPDPDAADKEHLLDLLEGQLNSEQWVAKAPIPADDPDWLRMNPDVKLAVQTSSPQWYKQYTQHPTGDSGRVFFNHYYQNTMVFSPVAEAAINATADAYSAMSPMEFFANCYAEYFSDPAGYSDSSKWGGGLPGSVKAFFKTHILGRQPYAAPAESGTMNPELTTNNDSGVSR